MGKAQIEEGRMIRSNMILAQRERWGFNSLVFQPAQKSDEPRLMG
jgi:hypothetical protein